MSVPSPSQEPWLVESTSLEPGRAAHYESVFALANGYAGARGSIASNLALGTPGFYIAGVFGSCGKHPGDREIVNLPCWLGIELNVDGFDVDLTRGEILTYRRALDMRQGMLFTRVTWRDGAGRRFRIASGRLMHKTRPHVAVQWGEITALDDATGLTVRHAIDAWSVKYGSSSQTPHMTKIASRALERSGIAMRLAVRDTDVRVGIASSLRLAGKPKRAAELTDDRIRETLRVAVKPGATVRFEKRVCFATSRDRDACDAVRELASVERVGLMKLAKEHARAWQRTWRDADVLIDGDDRAQKAVRFNVFHLASLGNPHDDRVSIGAKGLHGNGYQGKVFWDTETYMMPFFAHTDPAAARAQLVYRHGLLDDARENAKRKNRHGACFPWTSTDRGRDTFGAFGWQEHLQGDIAFAVDRYVQATGDDAFMLSHGTELVLETARYWASRVELDEGSGEYVMKDLMGPDEIHGGVHNNAFTNYLTRWHLTRAVELVGALRTSAKGRRLCKRIKLRDAEVDAWCDIATRIRIPFSEKRGFHEQFEGFFKLRDKTPDPTMTQAQYTGPYLHSLVPTKLNKQADTVLLYHMFRDLIPWTVRAAGWRYYVRFATHASTLSRGMYAAVAAQTGQTEKAYRLFIDAAEIDTGANAENDTGIHAASLGGTWQAAVMGFGGFGVRDGAPCFEPRLPRRWTRMAYTVAWRGRRIEVVATQTSVKLRTRRGSLRVRAGGGVVSIGPTWKTVSCREPGHGSSAHQTAAG